MRNKAAGNVSSEYTAFILYFLIFFIAVPIAIIRQLEIFKISTIEDA